MDYGFNEKQKIQNKIQNQKDWVALKAAHTTKHYILINGQDCEVLTPNQFSTSKLQKDAINPLHLK